VSVAGDEGGYFVAVRFPFHTVELHHRGAETAEEASAAGESNSSTIDVEQSSASWMDILRTDATTASSHAAA